MSITFAPVIEDSRVLLTCICRKVQSQEIFANPAEAYAHKASAAYTLVECEDEYCDNTRYVQSVIETPELNMSNVNARFVLEMLGYKDTSDGGSASAEEFMGRVLMALAIAPHDEGVPAHDDSSYDSNGVRISGQLIQGGRPKGYLQDRLMELETVATWAAENNTTIVWG